MNLLNGLFHGDLIEMFKSKGWQPIDTEEAFANPVFSAKPKVVPAGDSIVWSLAKEKGRLRSCCVIPPRMANMKMREWIGNKTPVVSGLGNAVTPPTATWEPEDLDDTASVSCAGAASEFDCRAGYEVSTSGPN